MTDDNGTPATPPTPHVAVATTGDVDPVDDLDQPDPTADQGDPDDLGDPGKRALEAERAAAREATKRAKTLERELAQLRRQNLGETERAITDAEDRGRKAAASEFGRRLARSTFDAAAARRNPGVKAEELDGIVEYVDMAKFLDDDGEVDAKAITAAVKRLVPAPTDQGPPSFDGGPRGRGAPKQGMNDIIRNLAGGNRASS
jgi:hypothetical protein